MRVHPGLLLVPVLLAAACDSSSPTSPGNNPIAVETVAKASYSGFSAPLRLTVRTAEELAAAWQTLHAGRSPVPPVPAVDFERSMVVLVAAGTRSNGCYAIDVTGASLSGSGAIEFEVTETTPGPTCGCTQAITQPVHVVKVARVAGPERFVERLTQRRC